MSYKAEKASEELAEAKKAIAVMGGKLQKIVDFRLCGTDMERTLLVIKKEKNTPKKYPRKAGTPTREPIL